MASDLEGLSAATLKARTGKKWGSKFSAGWSLERLVAWMAEEIEKAGWRRQGLPFAPVEIRLTEVVGLVEGENVHTIRVVCDGRYAHAYPVED